MAKIDTVDIGGAAKAGKPRVPQPTTAAYTDDGCVILEAPEKKADVDVPERVKRAAYPGASVAYPDTHPANDEDIAVSPDGTLMPEKGQTVAKDGAPRGHVDDERLLHTRTIAALNTLETEEKKMWDTPPVQQPVAPADLIAKSDAGVPLIEVEFHLDFGAVIGYYNKVEKQGQWLIFVVDNTTPARQRFVPNITLDQDKRPKSLDIVVTGKDRKPNRLVVTPLGIQFTVDHYDFMVMRVPPEAEDGEVQRS